MAVYAGPHRQARPFGRSLAIGKAAPRYRNGRITIKAEKYGAGDASHPLRHIDPQLLSKQCL
ncbi:hypothetical protein FLP41_03460 (plasmid) [Paracoccus marcusii]|uniref:hypothetical protein n=1 Tax=Paracoccus marcusii TaxID=59779 RepID=UPI002ECFD6A6|nr:hypothetical protein FLP41_03460 [Paracoccus marcusii]